MDTKTKISRKDFLKKSGVMAAALVLFGRVPLKAEASPTVEDAPISTEDNLGKLVKLDELIEIAKADDGGAAHTSLNDARVPGKWMLFADGSGDSLRQDGKKYCYSLEDVYPSAYYDILDILPYSETKKDDIKKWGSANVGGYSATNEIWADKIPEFTDDTAKFEIILYKKA